MSHYKHLTIEEREMILISQNKGKSLRSIAKEICRSVSTVSRELRRNTVQYKHYSAAKAQQKYHKRRKKCCKRKLLENVIIKSKVQKLFLEQQWSPEQISKRLKHEKSPYSISYRTIYRAIYAGMFDTPEQKRSTGNRGAIRKLRHRGKPRRKKGADAKRSNIAVNYTIHERPAEANNREVIGHWEADSVAGKRDGACLVTLTDRRSRYLLAEKVGNKKSEPFANKMIDIFANIPAQYVLSITPDRGVEFTRHADVTAVFDGFEFYFADPHSPWQRGTNENTNGLLREYFPKSFDFDSCSDDDIRQCVDRINLRPRKCLGWLSPFEVFFGVVLHLV